MLWCFILLNFLSVVCCWSSGHFPMLLWVLCLRGSSVFLHDQCCFDPDGWMLFPSLDVNLQLNLSLCVCLLYKSIFYTIFQLGNAILLFQCWVSGFSSLLTCKCRICNTFRVSLMMVTARISTGYLTNIRAVCRM